MTYRYPNKRVVKRVGGRFTKVTMKDVGIMGTCPTCNHFLIRVYDGDPEDKMINPFAFRNRCFTCESEEAP